jgi:hypothetical protein
MTTTKRLLIWVAIPAFVAGGYAVRGFVSADVSPLIEFPDAIQLGELDQGKVAIGRLVIANRGGSELRVGNVRTNCSCSGLEREVNGTVEAVTDLTILPGEAVGLRVRMATRGEPGQPLHTVLAFGTNDPRRPEGQIDIVVSRIRGIASSPAAVVFGNITLGQELTQTVALRDTEGKPLVVESVTCSDPDRLTARIIPGGPPGVEAALNAAYVEVSARAAAPGTIQGNVQIRIATATRDKVVEIPVTARVIAPVEVSPSRISLPRASADGPLFHMTCLCRSASGQPLMLTPLDVPPSIAVTVQEGDGAARLVRIEWRPPGERTAPGQQIVRLKAQTEGRDYPLEIRVDCKLPEG